MREFDYFAPSSLEEATEILSEHEPHILAGGTDLLLAMREQRTSPHAIMSLKQVPELQSIAYSPETGLRLGAMVTLRQLVRSQPIEDHYRCLADTALLMASEQIRSLATVGGNLCNAAPSADMAPPLIALDASVRIAGPDAERAMPLEEFFIGPGSTALEPGELLVEIEVPLAENEIRYMRLTPRAQMDIAVVGVAAGVQTDEEQVTSARVVLGAVAPTPLRVRSAEDALVGRPLTPSTIDQAASIAAQACSPISDVRGSDEYRRRMVGVFVKRVLGSPGEPALAAA